MKKKIILFSRDPAVRSQSMDVLGRDFELSSFESSDKFMEALGAGGSQMLILDIDFKDKKGQDTFRQIKRAAPLSRILIISDTAEISDAVETTRQGAADFLRKPLQAEQLLASVKENTKDRDAEFRISFPDLQGHEWLHGGSSRIRNLFRNIEKEIRGERDILFICEKGIDASVLAEIIHRNGKDRSKRLDIIDLASFTKESAENYFWTVIQEMVAEISAMKSDSCGTMFLENFDVIERPFQESILGYLESTFKRAVGNKVKLVIEVNKLDDVLELEKKNLLRIFSKIDIPTLRDRREDIPLMLASYMQKFSRKYGKEINAVSTDLTEALMTYEWPGNVTEFASMVELAVMNSSSGILESSSFPLTYRMVFDKVLKKLGEGTSVQTAEEKLLSEVVTQFKLKTGYGAEDISRIVDLPKDFIS